MPLFSPNHALALAEGFGLAFSPSAGPILAAAILQVVPSRTDGDAAVSILAFAIGAGIPMLVIAVLGRGLLARLAKRIRQGMGAAVAGSALLGLLGINLGMLVAPTSANAAPVPTAPAMAPVAAPAGQGPEIEGITHWINSAPLNLAQLKGKVVLVDFWAYSCINCIRTLPYIEALHERYKDAGLVVIGVHTPEFPFEGKADNVAAAVRKYGLTYPVAMDNDFATWNRFSNQYWPAHYLFDRNGRIVDTHFGEGAYQETEDRVRHELGLSGSGAVVTTPRVRASGQTPETYLGSSRAERFASPEDRARLVNYSFPTGLQRHEWALEGSWETDPDHIVSRARGSSLRLHYKAGKVFLVLGSATGAPIEAKVEIEGAEHNTSEDVHEGRLLVSGHRLYELARLDKVGEGEITLVANAPGLEAYAFTFGQ